MINDWKSILAFAPEDVESLADEAVGSNPDAWSNAARANRLLKVTTDHPIAAEIAIAEPVGFNRR